MTVATALVSGRQASPQLVEDAVRRAMQKADLGAVGGVLLFLTPEFARHPESAVLAAARLTRCTQVFGCVAAGICNEREWRLDGPAAAAMVIGDGLSLVSTGDDSPLLCCTSSPFPSSWANSRRFGLHFHGSNGQGAVWQSARLAGQGIAETHLQGAALETLLSAGVQPLGEEHLVSAVRGYDLLSVDGKPALDHLLDALPAAWRERAPLPLHLINVCTTTRSGESLCAAIITANADASLTLSTALQPGDSFRWGIRDPLAAADEMATLLAGATTTQPDFALYFSCIGRGPWFYGDQNQDLAALTRRFPGMPVIGAYGTGQIAFHDKNSRQLQNAVVTALYRKDPDVQPQP